MMDGVVGFAIMLVVMGLAGGASEGWGHGLEYIVLWVLIFYIVRGAWFEIRDARRCPHTNKEEDTP